MAFVLHVDKLEDDGTIRVRHSFYGDSEEECQELRDAHADGCKSLGPALKQDRTIEEIAEIDEMPEWEDSDADDD